jgi:filamentous hemagglutinin family protein
MKRYWRSHNSKAIWMLVQIGATIAFYQTESLAQITPDASLGAESSTVTPNVSINGSAGDRIDGGAIRGGNLFHSFEQFNVGEGQRVYFANPSGINNIFSRVTGRNLSNILGTLGVSGAANLFLLNPNGIIFGKNARLDVRGSFAASTASAIQFGDRGFFSAINPASLPLLNVNPSAFLFNQIASGRIENRSTAEISRRPERLFGLQVPENKSVLLLGGEILIDGGGLNAANGRIELAGVAGEGTIGLTVNGNTLSLSMPDSVARGNIAIANNARVNVSGKSGGFIQIQGNRVSLTNTSDITADTLANQNGQGISIRAFQLIVRDGSQISTTARENSLGNSGGITVNADLVEVTGTGSGGNSDNRPGGGARENERPSKLASDAQGEGEAGDLIVNTRQLIVQDGGKVSASTIDRDIGGNITINASESVELIGTSNSEQRSSGISVQTRGEGRGGGVRINTQRLIIRDGAELSASTFGEGAGGDLILNAGESLEVVGTSRTGVQTSRIVAETGRPLVTQDAGTFIGTGDGGSLTIRTGRLIVRDRGEVSVSGLSTGKAGELRVQASSIELDNLAAIAATTTSGKGGNITLEGFNLLLLRRHSRISTTAGTNRQGGDGGSITINGDLVVTIPNENSDITANAFSGTGGRINITTQALLGLEIRDRQQLQTLLGTTDLSQFDPSILSSSDVTAISQTSPDLSGEIAVQLQGIDPSKGLVELPTEPVDVTGLIDQNLCHTTQGSEFTITGRGGLPTPPNEALNGNNTWEDWRIGETSQTTTTKPTTSNKPEPIVEAQGWYKDANGNIILTAETTTVTPHRNWLNFPNCQP